MFNIKNISEKMWSKLDSKKFSCIFIPFQYVHKIVAN